MYNLDDVDNYDLNTYSRKKNGNRLKVFGKGIVSAKPDTAEIVIGVTTENIQLEVAQEENARATQQVINGIMELGVLSNNIQTENYNIRINYDYIDGKQVFRSYEVINNLRILIKDIQLVGKIIDTAVKNGANVVSGLTFIVSNQPKYYYEALRLAIQDAQNKAIAIANKLGVTLNLIPIQINEQERATIAPLGTVTFKAADVTTPIEAGENKITADIEVEFIYNM